MELKIYNKANNLRLTASPNSSSSLTEEIGGECCVSVSFTHTSFVLLDVDNYIEVLGIRYKIKRQYRPKQKNTQTYEYSVKFYAPIHDAEDVLMLFSEGDTTSEFYYDGGPREHLQLWVDNMNRLAGKDVWSIGTVISAENKNIEYKNLNCWDAAYSSNGIAATFETEMWADGFVINLCKASHGERQELGYMQGLTNLSQEDNGEVKFFTRLFPLGSTRNINASKYGYSRLQLPSRAKYVDKNVDLYGVKEETEEAAFSAIYPKYVGTISSVRTEEKENEEGRKYTVYYFKDNSMSFNPDDYQIPEYTYMLEFQTGELAGRGTDGSFQAAWHENTKEWEITNVYPDDTTQIPGGVIIPKPGDQYIPWNFSLPQEYTTAAEQAYELAVNNFLSNYSFDPNKYTGTTDRNYVERNNTPLRIGQNVRLLSDNYFTDGYKDTRIIKVQRKLNDLCQATITCSDKVGTGWKSSVDNRLNNLQYVLSKQEQQAIIDIIKTTDSKSPSDYNVFSALKARAEFISKKFNDTVIGILTFLQTAIFRAGATFGKDGFASGLTGFGAKVDENGNAEVESLISRRFIETPELRYNRVDVKVGDKWRAPGAGIIESVDTENKICTLKLEEGEIGAVAVGDICIGIFHSLTTSDNATEDTDDSRGNRTFAGFCTVYFTIIEVIGSRNKQFKYQIRPVSDRWKFSFDPFAQMNFVAYGSFTREDRQTSVYETRTYTRHLWKQNTWEIGVANIAKQSGDLSNLNVFGMNMEGYSEYTNSVYFTGTITQVKPDGTPVITANDRGAWENNTQYFYYDRVSHNGCIWLCINEDGTDTEPSEQNPNWLLEVSKGEAGQDGTSFRILGSKNDPEELPQDGNQVGDGYLIQGHLWVWSGTEWNDAGVIQGPAGESVQNMGGWYEGLFVPYLGVVRMSNATFMCVKKEGTYNPPFYTLLDNKGNRIKSESGYILSGTVNNAEYQLIAADGNDGQDGMDGVPGKDGVDGKTLYTWIMYADDAEGNGISNEPIGKGFIGFAYNKETPLESNNPEDYIWSDIKGEQGVQGEKGEDGKQYYTWIAYSDYPNGMPMYQQPKDTTEYIGIAVNKETQTESNDPADYTWSKFKGDKGDKGDQGDKGETGDKGDSISLLGQWHDGMVVPYLGVVTMGGNSFAAKVATLNPPMWTLKDNNGNRIKSERGYILTGEINTAEYELIAEKGQDGLDGLQGANGKDGIAGKDGVNGKTSYFHIKYSENENGYPMTETPSKYIGTYVDFEETDSDDYTKYAWARFEGLQGEKGEQGIPGYNGEDGKTYYLHIKYSNDGGASFTDNNGEDSGDYIGVYTDTNPNDSNTPSDYKWSKIKGEKGEQGIQGLQGEKGEQGIQGEQGADGRTSYFHIKYSVNANGNPMTEVPSTYIGTYVDFEETDSDDYTKYTWARFEGIQGEKGEQGIPGANGENGQTSYLHIAYANSSDGSVGFSVSDSTNKSYIGQYTDFEQNDSTDYRKYSWTKIKGEQGDGYTQMGQWYDGMVVPKMGVVSMGGGSYVAKVATSNPPLWTILDNQGRRLKSNKGYILTGGINTAEYDVWAEKGEQGDKGDKGEQGIQGSPGATGAQGKQGIEGCIVRDSEWTIGTEYRNDSNITDGSLAVRYVDVALVRNNATATGWDAYRCMRTHVASSSITYTNTSYWEKFSTNVGAIFTSLIIAKNAKIQFLQGNQLTIQKSDGTITAGLSGSDAGQKIRIWAGGNNPDTATFKVSETGEMWATNAHIQGEVNATSGVFTDVQIFGTIRTPWKNLTYKLIYTSPTGDVYGYDGSAIDDDRIIVTPMIGSELLIAWGDNANGRDVLVSVGTPPSDTASLKIKVPSGYKILYGNSIYSGGAKMELLKNTLYRLIGFKDKWIVKIEATNLEI